MNRDVPLMSIMPIKSNCEAIVLQTHYRGLSCYFNYSINKLSLSHNNTIKDLGVILDSKLTFNKHVKSTIVDYIRNKSFIDVGMSIYFYNNVA